VSNTLYVKHNYLDKSLNHIVSASIKEYDIKSAGFNMLIAAKAIPQTKIDELNAMPKKERNIKIGLMIKKDKELGKIINQNLVEYRRTFMERNNISDASILSIKKDAIFLINQPVTSTKFGNVEFVLKNRYSSYYNLGDIEFYYSREYLHIKGLGKDVPKIHRKYMIKFLRKLFRQAEEVTDMSIICQAVRTFADDYRKKKLDIEYYREMNSDSMFMLNSGGIMGTSYKVPWTPDLEMIDIRYNYMTYIVPLIKIFF